MLFDNFFHCDEFKNEAYIQRLESFHTRRYSPLLLALLLALLGFGYWANNFTISEVAKAPGEVIASSRVQLIQAVDGGVLASLVVHEGDRVKTGQVLAKLDDTRLTASAKEVAVRLSALRAKETRLRAEITGADNLVFPDDVLQYPSLVEVESALFAQRRNGLKKEQATLNTAIELSREEVKMMKSLARSGDTNRSELLRTERALNDSLAAIIVRENQFYENVGSELTTVDNEIAQNEQILAQRTRQLEDSVFTAPVSGIVKNIRVTTVGGVLSAGEELMQIIPVDDQLLIEAKIRPADIARVKTGHEATLRFDPFDYTIYGGVTGRVVYVSADTLKEETRNGEEAYYRAHIVPQSLPVTTTIGRKLQILPGMTAQVDIRTGSRTVMGFLTETAAQNTH